MVVLCSFALCIFSFQEVDELQFKPEGPQRHQKHTHIHKDVGAYHKSKSKSPQNQKKKNTIEN